MQKDSYSILKFDRPVATGDFLLVWFPYKHISIKTGKVYSQIPGMENVEYLILNIQNRLNKINILNLPDILKRLNGPNKVNNRLNIWEDSP